MADGCISGVCRLSQSFVDETIVRQCVQNRCVLICMQIGAARALSFGSGSWHMVPPVDNMLRLTVLNFLALLRTKVHEQMRSVDAKSTSIHLAMWHSSVFARWIGASKIATHRQCSCPQILAHTRFRWCLPRAQVYHRMNCTTIRWENVLGGSVDWWIADRDDMMSTTFYCLQRHESVVRSPRLDVRTFQIS